MDQSLFGAAATMLPDLAGGGMDDEVATLTSRLMEVEDTVADVPAALRRLEESHARARAEAERERAALAAQQKEALDALRGGAAQAARAGADGRVDLPGRGGALRLAVAAICPCSDHFPARFSGIPNGPQVSKRDHGGPHSGRSSGGALFPARGPRLVRMRSHLARCPLCISVGIASSAPCTQSKMGSNL